jgi:hypothetical protein
LRIGVAREASGAHGAPFCERFASNPDRKQPDKQPDKDQADFPNSRRESPAPTEEISIGLA